MKNNELILILDFGGQYNQLIARRVRECNVYSEVVPYNISIEKIKEKNPKGITNFNTRFWWSIQPINCKKS